MQSLFRSLFFICIILKFAIEKSISPIEVCFFLGILTINIIKEKFYCSLYLLILEFILITVACTYDKSFILLYGVLTFDVGLLKRYELLIPVYILVIYFNQSIFVAEYLLIVTTGFMFGCLNLTLNEKVSSFRETYDNERRYRYELESAKKRLLNAAKETAYIAEIRERNRIAREIHDTVGHSMAGLLMQLQAAYKIREKNEEKSMELLKKSIDGLSETLNLMRDTVHNMKPHDTISVDYIQSIIDNFKFCPIEFKCIGNFNLLSPEIIETISTNIKESLTNASKYSKASKIEVSININEKYVRFYIKDDGIGIKKFKEGFGLEGIRDRVRSLGGSVSISGDDGFLIVCNIPIDRKKGGVIFESNNS